MESPADELVCKPATSVVTADAESETVAGLDKEPSVAEILRCGESGTVEFKSSLRTNLHTKNPDAKIEHAVLKTIAAFLNSDGGTLVVGADDKGTPLGLDADGFQNDDKILQHLANLIRDRLGAHQSLFIDSRVADCEGKRLLLVTCKPSKSPAYVKDGKVEYFYVRSGTTTAELPASQIHDYVQHRFG
jgi:predicted HTH transcriptional regulator